jgi:hypothetical protein
MALGQLLSMAATSSIKSAPIAIGALGTAGFVGAGGDPRGVPAGIAGSVGGGARGAFSGAVLGGMLGLGAVGAAMHMPGAGRVVGKMLHTVMKSRPAQHVQSMLAAGPSAAHRDLATRMGSFAGLSPTRAAASFTEAMLVDKQRRLMQAAALGGLGGAMAGIPLGALRSAYLGGRRTTGPQGIQG